jgi:hypothetical protein
MLMAHPTIKESKSIQWFLSNFTDASCTTINLSNFHFLFFNTSPAIQVHISKILGFQRISLSSKYLIYPLIENGLLNSSWGDILSIMNNNFANWSFRSLNVVGKLVLLKSILHAMTIYLFSSLAAPKLILKDVLNIQRNFLCEYLEKKWARVS